MITCWFGKLGQGKTYALAEHTLRQLKSGRKCKTNFFVDWKGARKVKVGPYVRSALPKNLWQPFESVEEFMDMEDCFVGLDEGWIYFDSYKLTSFPIEVRMKILQSRKDGLDIGYTTQRPEQVHVSLRAMTNQYYECVAGRIPFMRYPIFYRYDADIVNGIVKRDTATGWEERKTADGGSQWIAVETEQKPKILWPKKEVFESFDTTEKIAIPVKESKKLRHAPKKLKVKKQENEKKQIRKRNTSRNIRIPVTNEDVILEEQQHSGIREKQRRKISVQKSSEVHAERIARHNSNL